MSGEWPSKMVTMSEREGMLAPALCALSVRIVRSVAIGGAVAGDLVCPALTCVPCGLVGLFVYVGLAMSEARVLAIP